MNKKNRVTAIVPMRHNSERVPGKNYRDFAGKPLFHWILDSILECPSIDAVVVDTDSPTIKESCRNNYSDVIVLDRPDHLKAGEIPMNDVLVNITNQIPSDIYFQTHSTNPLLTPQSIQKAVTTLLDLYPVYDSLFSVTRLQTRLWNQLNQPINHNENILLRTQDLPPIYEENSCIYLFTKSILEERHNRIGLRPYMFEIDPMEAQDIDVELDFVLAEFLCKKMNNL